ncbi:MAG: hypothetical protein L3J52_04530 [Proteobacteria bacterium]|nr:hypothetical protein [Pseudomonadota bacterium]
MQDILSTSTIELADSIHDQFVQNQPFKHVVIEDFFSKDFCQAILDDFPDFDKKLATDVLVCHESGAGLVIVPYFLPR